MEIGGNADKGSEFMSNGPQGALKAGRWLLTIWG